MSPHELYSAVYTWFYIIGIFLIIDDLIEHFITGDTPFRLLFEKIIVPLLRKL